jgi:hypothetical protein
LQYVGVLPSDDNRRGFRDDLVAASLKFLGERELRNVRRRFRDDLVAGAA